MNGIGKEFMELTKYKHLEKSEESRGVPQPPLQMEYDPVMQVVQLPSPENLKKGTVSYNEVMIERKSLRRYSDKPLSSEEFSYLLWCTQGVKQTKPGFTKRTVPSAGARHAFETYLLVNNVEGLKPGLYRFLALENKLVEMQCETDITDKVVAGCLGQGFVGMSAVTFIWSAVVPRMKWRYGERGYRYLHLDAGHVCQNLYLAAEAVGCGACAIAAFDDDYMNEVLKFDGEEQFVIYVASVGKK